MDNTLMVDLEDVLDSIGENLELIHDEAEIKSIDTQRELVVELDRVDDALRSIYSKLYYEKF